ncbi:MAG: hypothetical protein OXG72_16975 [Acidobacteria bacterium]|nr:hypothetical protein [Acidobacteriota bacterium]
MEDEGSNPAAWAAMSGDWSFRESSAEYTQLKDASQPIGVALSSARIRNGRVSTRIRLGDPAENAGRILLGYNTVTDGYFSAGLGGYGRAYVIDEHVPRQGWKAVKHNGRAAQLDGSTEYDVEVEVRGQRVRLAVDGIELMDQYLPHPLEGRQVGLFARGPGPVTFEDVAWSGARPRAFVVMQFTEPFDSLYAEVIRPVCEELQFEAYRADDVFRPGLILQDIVSGLVESDVIIAEITPTNANVFYELGYAHARNTPTVLLARRNGALPFDISGHRVIFYDDSIRGKPEVEVALRKHLSGILRSSAR